MKEKEPVLSSITGSNGTRRHRGGAHRVVQAAQQSSSPFDLTPISCGIFSTEKPYKPSPHTIGSLDFPLLVRFYSSFQSLVEERRNPDQFEAEKKELQMMQPKPPEENLIDKIKDDKPLTRVFSMLGFASRDAAIFSSTCRRLHFLFHSKCLLHDVRIIPNMLSIEEFTRIGEMEEDSVRSTNVLAQCFAMYKRGQHVHSLALVESKFASTLPILSSSPIGCLSKILSLICEMPYLSVLDIRGVSWSAESMPMATYFLSDLYLACPQITTLKIGVELYLSWVPGWWHRHSELSTLVIASRREQPPPQFDVTPWTISLHPDLLTMLQSDRPWRFKCWAAVEDSSLRHLLFPSAPFPSLTELALNVFGCSPLSFPVESTEGVDSKKGKVSKRPAFISETDIALFPRLTSLTVANIEENPLLAVEFYAKFCASAQTPKISFFSVCNTVKYPPPERVKTKRRLMKSGLPAKNTG